MRAIDIVRTKRDGGELSLLELTEFVEAAARDGWPDYQLSALLMAIYLQGMSDRETADLTRLMVNSGDRLDLSDLPGPKIDKHSTGGVGDKTSLILAPLAAACGVVVPMMSGRGLGHTGGTLDKLEAIPGFRVNLTEAEFRVALKAVGIGMIGQTSRIAPADKKLYALRDVTSTVESIPLITASILSKKLAEGITGLVLDVKCGAGAFMPNLKTARELAQSLVRVAKLNGLRCDALITAMDAPLGRAVGNSLEVIESIETLKGRGPADLAELSIKLAARMVQMAGIELDSDAAITRIKNVIRDGSGVERFAKMVEQQGGDPRVIDNYSLLPHAPKVHAVVSNDPGYVLSMNAADVGVAAMMLGAGRRTATDTVDPAVGIIVRTKVGEAVRAGGAMFDVHYQDDADLTAVLPLLQRSYTLCDDVPTAHDLILEQLV